MRSFTYDALPGRVLFGAGVARERLAAEVERLGAHRVFLVFGEPERKLAEELADPLAKHVAGTFTQVRPHVPVEIAESASAAAISAGADCLLSVGGGSTTGTAKAIAMETWLPIIAVPTTYAGSEMTPIWGLTESGRKATGRDHRVLPRVVLYDPALTVTLPASITGPSAINALAHCVEAFYAPGANPITSLLAEEGIRALSAGVRVAVRAPEDLDARSETLYGAYLAGAAFAAAGSGLHHKICHALGGAFDLPHAQTHTVVLPHAVAFNEPAMPEIVTRVRSALGAEEGAEPAVSAAGALYDLAVAIGAPTALSEIGMRPEGIEEVADQIVAAVPEGNPRPVDRDGIEGLLRDAFEGRRPAATEAALR